MHLWSSKVDELLGDIMVEENFDSIFFEIYRQLFQTEWIAMQENFLPRQMVIWLSGMTEEWTKFSYGKNDYYSEHFFVEDYDQKDDGYN